LLASAVTGFQQKYYTDTLAPWGLKYGTGYAGRTTIAKLTAIYGCGVVQPTPTPVESYIKIIAPNGGEVWNTGSTYNIKWNVPDITRVSIYVLDHSTGRPSTVSTGIVAVVPNTGSYQWKIPSSMPAGNYRVRVLGCPDSFSNTACANVIMSDYGYDESDSYFSITEETAGVTSPCGNYGDVDGDGFVTQADSDLVLNYGVGNVTLTAEQIENADVSNNGATSAYDSALILQYIEGIITTFPACPVGTLNNVENSLANISKATDELMKKIAELLKK